MFLFYGDQSGHTGGQGDPGQPVLVVAGILVNTYGAAKTRREFRELMDELGEIAGQPLRELKAQALVRGRNEWNGVGHEDRAEARNRVLEWLGERGHTVVASGIVYGRLEQACAACPEFTGIRPRVLATVHTELAIQKAHYSTSASDQRRNASLLFYDHQDADQPQIARAIANPRLGAGVRWRSDTRKRAQRDRRYRLLRRLRAGAADPACRLRRLHHPAEGGA